MPTEDLILISYIVTGVLLFVGYLCVMVYKFDEIDGEHVMIAIFGGMFWPPLLVLAIVGTLMFLLLRFVRTLPGSAADQAHRGE